MGYQFWGLRGTIGHSFEAQVVGTQQRPLAEFLSKGMIPWMVAKSS